MVKQMKLKGQVQLSLDRSMKFISKMYDGTEFEIAVDEHDVEINDEFLPERLRVDGWCNVIQEAQQSDRCYLTLPKPSITHGKQVLVNQLQLMPRVTSIASFKPTKTGGGVTQLQLDSGDVVEIDSSEFVSSSLAKAMKVRKPRKSRSKS